MFVDLIVDGIVDAWIACRHKKNQDVDSDKVERVLRVGITVAGVVVILAIFLGLALAFGWL